MLAKSAAPPPAVRAMRSVAYANVDLFRGQPWLQAGKPWSRPSQPRIGGAHERAPADHVHARALVHRGATRAPIRRAGFWSSRARDHTGQQKDLDGLIIADRLYCPLAESTRGAVGTDAACSAAQLRGNRKMGERDR